MTTAAPKRRTSKTKKNAKPAESAAAPEVAVPEACACAHAAPVTPGVTCEICNGVIPAPAAELPPAEPAEDPAAAEEALLSGDGAVGAPAAAPAPERAPLTEAERIAESRQALLQPAPIGTKFFESPEGYVMVGEADKSHIWCKQANGGQGGWINPRRG